MEYADEYKLESETNPIEGGFEVKYTIIIDFLPKEDQEWFETGVGKNIKATEQDAAKKLLETLERYGFANNKKFPMKKLY